MKFVKVLEHNGELYRVGDTIYATFDGFIHCLNFRI